MVVERKFCQAVSGGQVREVVVKAANWEMVYEAICVVEVEFHKQNDHGEVWRWINQSPKKFVNKAIYMGSIVTIASPTLGR